MSASDIIVIDGRAYSWRAVCELRRRQVEAWKAARPRQPALFELRDDRRPVAERTAVGRFAAPTLLTWLSGAGRDAPT